MSKQRRPHLKDPVPHKALTVHTDTLEKLFAICANCVVMDRAESDTIQGMTAAAVELADRLRNRMSERLVPAGIANKACGQTTFLDSLKTLREACKVVVDEIDTFLEDKR